jgi:hypothetical protein
MYIYIMNTQFFISRNNFLKTQKTLWLIINNFLIDKLYFRNTKINQLHKDYWIAKKTLIKYFKKDLRKVKWKNEKRLYITNIDETNFLEKIRKILNETNNINNNSLDYAIYLINFFKKCEK